MNNELQVWQYNKNKIRTVTILGEPWFIAGDVCTTLGLTHVNMAMQALEPSEKGSTIVATLGGEQSMTVVNESGMYALIFKSRKKEAKYFRLWVTGTVLPEIRKHGAYTIAPTTPALAVPTTFSEALFLAAKQAEQIERQQERLELEAPKVAFFDAVADVSDTTNMNTAAKTLGIKGLGRTNMFDLLRKRGILLSDNQPYQRYINAGYFRVVARHWNDDDGNGHLYHQTRVTPMGLDFIRKIVQGESLFPVAP